MRSFSPGNPTGQSSCNAAVLQEYRNWGTDKSSEGSLLVDFPASTSRISKNNVTTTEFYSLAVVVDGLPGLPPITRTVFVVFLF